MKVRVRRVLYWSGAVLAGLLVACYAILSSMAFDDLVALLQDEVRQATGRDLTVAGPIDLQISLRPSVDLQDVRFANAAWGSRADMVTIRRLEVEVDLLPLLAGDIVVNRLVLDAPDILLETDAEGTGNWEFEPAGATAGSDTADAAEEDRDGIVLPDVQAFAVRGGRLILKGAGPGQDLRLDLTEASGLVPEGAGSRSLVLKGRYNDNPFSVDGTFGNLRDILSGEASPLDLSVEAGGTRASIQGTAGDLVGAASAKLAVTAQGDGFAGLAPFVGSDIPDMGPFKLSGRINITAELIDFAGVVAEIGSSDVAGAGTLDLARERPFLTADLVAKTLNLADFLPPGGAAPAAAAEADQSAEKAPEAGPTEAGGKTDGARLFSEEPLALEGLSAFDGRLSVSAGEFRVTPRLALSEVKLAAQLQDGRLRIEPMNGRLAGGALTGRAGLDAADPVAAVEVALRGDGLDFGQLLEDAEISDEVRGELDLDVDLFSRGESLHGWAASLGGHVQAVSQDGTIDNDLLGIFSAGFSDITGPLFGSAETANVNCIIGRFDVAGGQVKSRALVLDTGTFAVTGRGGIDLRAEQVNLAFDTETSEPSLASLAIPFKVVGPIEDPSVVPDPLWAATNVVGTVGRAAEAGGDAAAKAVNTLGSLVGTGPLIGQTGSDQTLCDAALAAIGEGMPVAPAGAGAAAKPSGKSSEKSLADEVEDATKDVGRSIEKGLKSLFGD